MCWNAEVSLQSFLIGITAIGIAYQKGLSLPISLFSLTIVCMQLVEFFVWTYYGNKDVNFVASMAGAALIWLQPIASMLTLPTSIQLPSMMTYSILSLTGFFLDPQPLREKFKMERAENGHLAWNFINKKRKSNLLLSVYFFFLLLPLVLSKHWALLSIVLIMLALSVYNFWTSNTWGSMWCWLVNYLVVGVCVYRVLVPKP